VRERNRELEETSAAVCRRLRRSNGSGARRFEEAEPRRPEGELRGQRLSVCMGGEWRLKSREVGTEDEQL